jgi:hypothetical protein
VLGAKQLTAKRPGEQIVGTRGRAPEPTQPKRAKRRQCRPAVPGLRGEAITAGKLHHRVKRRARGVLAAGNPDVPRSAVRRYETEGMSSSRRRLPR